VTYFVRVASEAFGQQPPLQSEPQWDPGVVRAITLSLSNLVFGNGRLSSLVSLPFADTKCDV
jgi:hypothetical protein